MTNQPRPTPALRALLETNGPAKPGPAPSVARFIPRFDDEAAYQAFRAQADEPELLHDDLAAYRANVVEIIRTAKAGGAAVVHEPMVLADLLAWLRTNHLPNTGPNRARYYATLAPSAPPT